ncbi:Pol I core factor CF, partial [Lobosporangium transversale]
MSANLDIKWRHVGFQEEEGEFDANAGSMHHRKLKVKKRKRKVKELTVFVGAHADYLLVQSAQLIFRHQIHDMIHHLGFPPELESVAREYWTLYMSLLTVFQDKWQLSGIKSLSTDTTVNENEMDSDNEHSGTQREQTDVESGQELNPDRFKDKTAAPESRPDQLDTMNEYHDNHDSSEESEIEDDSENDDAVPPSPGVQDEDLPEEENGNDGSKTKYRYYRRSNGLKFSMSYLIAICYISAHHLRIPVVFEDFYRWTRDRKIVYYNAVDTLPKEMGCRLVGEQRILLIPKHRKRDVFESATTRLLEWFRKKFGITPPRANMPPFVFRFIQELMLP